MVSLRMQAGNVLTNCNGQDLTRRGAKQKGSRLMVVLPAQLACKSATIEGTLGTIQKANTENPELVIPTSEVFFLSLL